MYILDSTKGVFIFRMMGNGELEESDHISTNTYGNKEILVKEASIIIKYIDQEGHKLMELNYNSDSKTAYLVRYFRPSEVIQSLSLQAVPVTNQGGRLKTQEFLFYVTDMGQIEAYPFGLDPRTINSVHNGVKMHVEGAIKLIYLFEDIYVIVSSEGLIYARISIYKPKLICLLSESTGHVYY